MKRFKTADGTVLYLIDRGHGLSWCDSPDPAKANGEWEGDETGPIEYSFESDGFTYWGHDLKSRPVAGSFLDDLRKLTGIQNKGG